MENTQIPGDQIPQVQIELQNLQTSVNTLTEKISRLRERLFPVSRPQALCKEVKKAEKEHMVPIASEIYDIVWEVALCIDSIDEAMDLLEV